MEIIYAVAVLGVLGCVFGATLAGFSKLFEIKKDKREEEVLNLLSGANCGACGYPGCAAYAKAIIEGEAEVNLCKVCDEETVNKIADIMGKAPVKHERFRAQVLCSGTSNLAKDKYRYQGLNDCVSAYNLAKGPKECPYGCMGLGTCVNVCKFGAIKIENNVAVVEYEKCQACGMCVTACPKNIIKLIPFKAKVWVGCHSADKGKTVMDYCKVGCISCGKCVRTCRFDAISIVNDCAVIDYDKCTACGECVAACPRKIIWKDDIQINTGDTISDEAVN